MDVKLDKKKTKHESKLLGQTAVQKVAKEIRSNHEEILMGQQEKQHHEVYSGQRELLDGVDESGEPNGR